MKSSSTVPGGQDMSVSWPKAEVVAVYVENESWEDRRWVVIDTHVGGD